MRYYYRFVIFITTLLLPLLANAQRAEVRVTLLSAIPDQLFLELASPNGWQALDSAWPSDDGRYYLHVQRFTPGLYQLRLSNLGALPLLLSQYKKMVLVNLQGPNFAAFSCVKTHPTATTYLHATHLQELADRWDFLATQASKMDGETSRSLSLIDSLASIARLRLNAFIDSSLRSTPDTLLQHFLLLKRRPNTTAREAWWPTPILLDSLIAYSDALRQHAQHYFYEQLNDSYSRPRLDSAFAKSLRRLAELPMHTAVARRLRAYSQFFFSEAHYFETARIAAIEPFGPLPAAPSLAPSIEKRLTANDALKASVKDLNGKDIPLINTKTRYTLVIMWSVWCPHCQTLLPHIYTWWSNLQKGLLDVVAIAIDQRSDALRAHIKLKGWKWRNAVEEDNGNSKLLELLGFEGTPQLLLLDSLGNTITQPQTLIQLRNQF